VTAPYQLLPPLNETAKELVRQARLLDACEAEVDALIEDLETERARRRKAEARANHLTGDVVRLRRT
jgi:hypothetical protein